MKLPELFRQMNENDVCCSKNREFNDFTCPDCGTDWVYDNEWKTTTEFGEMYINSITEVCKEKKPLRFEIVMGYMATHHKEKLLSLMES